MFKRIIPVAVALFSLAVRSPQIIEGQTPTPVIECSGGTSYQWAGKPGLAGSENTYWYVTGPEKGLLMLGAGGSLEVATFVTQFDVPVINEHVEFAATVVTIDPTYALPVSEDMEQGTWYPADKHNGKRTLSTNVLVENSKGLEMLDQSASTTVDIRASNLDFCGDFDYGEATRGGAKLQNLPLYGMRK